MKKSTLCLFFSALTLMLLSSAAFAELAYIDPVTNQGVLDQVSQKFFNKAKSWHTALESAAIRLFWTLVLISMVWTFGMMALRKADRFLLLAFDQCRIRTKHSRINYRIHADVG